MRETLGPISVVFNLVLVQAPRSIADVFNLVFPVSSGTLCSGNSPAQHARGPAFNRKHVQVGVPEIVGRAV